MKPVRGKTADILCQDKDVFNLPEAPGARADVRGAAATVVVRDALRAAKVFGQEVQLVHRWLERQLVQPLLGRAGRLQTPDTTQEQ